MESSSETPQVRYAWEEKKEEAPELQVAEEYEDVEEKKEIAKEDQIESTPVEFNKEIPSPITEETITPIESGVSPEAEADSKSELVISLEPASPETKMIDDGEDQPEELIPIKVNSPEMPATEEETAPEQKTEEPAESSVLEIPTVEKIEETIKSEENLPEVPKLDEKTKERLDFLGQEIFDRWEEYKTQPQREKLTQIDFEEITEKNAEEKDAMLKDFEASLRSFFCRLIIKEEKQKLNPENQTGDSMVEENKNPSQRELIDDKLKKLVFSEDQKENLKNFIFEVTENLRFKNFEEKYDPDNVKEYSIEEDKMKNISRDELGQLLLGMAKEEMDKAGTIPTEEVLVSTYEEKFGSYLKLRDLFDLEILAKENKIIDEMAKEKDIQNVGLLTEAFSKFIQNKKTEKEQKIRAYLAKRLQA